MCPKKRDILRKWEDSEQIFLDLANLDFLMVLMKYSGLALFNYSFKGEDLRYELIGGFLTAITMFQQEISEDFEKEIGEEDSFELNYKQFKIFVNIYKEIMVILISERDPSDGLKQACNSFKYAFYKRFQSKISDFNGNRTAFNEASELVLKHFDMRLLYPHVTKSPRDAEVKKLRGLQLTIYKSANELYGQNQYFYIPNLIETITKVRKEPKIQILDVIRDLHLREIFFPISAVQAEILRKDILESPDEPILMEGVKVPINKIKLPPKPHSESWPKLSVEPPIIIQEPVESSAKKMSLIKEVKDWLGKSDKTNGKTERPPAKTKKTSNIEEEMQERSENTKDEKKEISH